MRRKTKAAKAKAAAQARRENREKMRRYRARLRAAGLRPVQLWLPDTRDPKFIAEVRRESMLLRDDPHEQEVLDRIERVVDTSGWK